MGTYNSGCAKIEVPVLNQAPDGPMLMVSHANTNPGLTKTWDPGEPEKYYPAGTRNYARVVTTDDYQGAAIAQFVGQGPRSLKKCYVVNDNQTYGQGVARAFVDGGRQAGHRGPRQRPVGREADQLQRAVREDQGARTRTASIIGGIYDNNGGQLIKDKVDDPR